VCNAIIGDGGPPGIDPAQSLRTPQKSREFGLLMTPLPGEIVGVLAMTTIAFALALHFVKIAVFSRLRIG
jgi:hypothetical protein